MSVATTKELEGKLAIITGGGRGIGAAIAENLASKGCNLVLVYTSESSASKAAELSSKFSLLYNTSSITVRANLEEQTAPVTILDAIRQSDMFAGPGKPPLRIDIVVNNSGTAGNHYIADVTAEEFFRQYKVNTLAPLLLVQACLPYLPHDASGRIISLSSVSTGLGLPSQSVYAGTKGALETMTRVWARELKDRATSNCVNPGPVATDMYGGTTDDFKEIMRPFIEHTPGMNALGGAGRAATAEEIAKVVGLIASPDSQWINGSVVSCNGGMIPGI